MGSFVFKEKQGVFRKVKNGNNINTLNIFSL